MKKKYMQPTIMVTELHHMNILSASNEVMIYDSEFAGEEDEVL